MEWFENFWAIYSNLVLSLGTNAPCLLYTSPSPRDS